MTIDSNRDLALKSGHLHRSARAESSSGCFSRCFTELSLRVAAESDLESLVVGFSVFLVGLRKPEILVPCGLGILLAFLVVLMLASLGVAVGEACGEEGVSNFLVVARAARRLPVAASWSSSSATLFWVAASILVCPLSLELGFELVVVLLATLLLVPALFLLLSAPHLAFGGMPILTVSHERAVSVCRHFW